MDVMTCPGCHLAIHDGAAERGWCLDCRPLTEKELDIITGREGESLSGFECIEGAGRAEWYG